MYPDVLQFCCDLYVAVQTQVCNTLGKTITVAASYSASPLHACVPYLFKILRCRALLPNALETRELRGSGGWEHVVFKAVFIACGAATRLMHYVVQGNPY